MWKLYIMVFLIQVVSANASSCGQALMGSHSLRTYSISFWQQGWPYLEKQALEHGTTPAKMIEEYLTLQDLIYTEGRLYDENTSAKLQMLREQTITRINILQSFANAGNLKPEHWEQVHQVMSALFSLAQLAYELERTWTPVPSLDPRAPLTPAQLDQIFTSLENSTLDHAAALASQYRDHVLPETDPIELIAETEPATNTPVNPESNLARVLENGGALSDEIEYVALTAKNVELHVKLSRELIKDAHTSEANVLRTLLRSIFTGRGDRGVKLLTDIGPRIIELKARINGHKRILGCLEGRELLLKILRDMPETRAGYSRVIPQNFCKD